MSCLDNDGTVGASLGSPVDSTFESSFDFRLVARFLHEAGAPLVRVSRNAGGYVGERTYHAPLSSAGPRAIPTFLLHVPPAATLSSARQTRIVRSLLAALAASPEVLSPDSPLAVFGRDAARGSNTVRGR